MAMTLLIVIVVSAFINMYADIILVSGKDASIKNQDELDIISKTPEKNIIRSGQIGVFALSMWMGVLYFLSFIDGNMGILAMLSFAMYIGSIMVFHVACSHIFIMAKNTDMERKYLEKMLFFYMIPCIIFSLLYTGIMAYLGFSGVLKMHLSYYITLPFASTVLFQFGLSKVIKIKHFDSIAGTVSMLIAMLGTIGIIASNYSVF